MSNANGIKADDNVTWMHSRKVGKGFSFATRKGKVIHASATNIAIKHKGEIVNLPPHRVRKEGQRTELTEMVEGIVD